MGQPETIDESILGLMKKMDLQDKLVVPIGEVEHARVYANYLKETTDQLYSVNIIGTKKTNSNFVLIRRTK